MTSTTVPDFIKKLYEIVSDPNIDNVTWHDNNSFIIYEPGKLENCLKTQFKSTKTKSFVRQLHFYGFNKIGGSRYENWIYCNENFTIDGKTLSKVRRKTSFSPDDVFNKIKEQNKKIETQNCKINKLQFLVESQIKEIKDLKQKIEEVAAVKSSGRTVDVSAVDSSGRTVDVAAVESSGRTVDVAAIRSPNQNLTFNGSTDLTFVDPLVFPPRQLYQCLPVLGIPRNVFLDSFV
jgi:hypothetical protein